MLGFNLYMSLAWAETRNYKQCDEWTPYVLHEPNVLSQKSLSSLQAAVIENPQKTISYKLSIHFDSSETA